MTDSVDFSSFWFKNRIAGAVNVVVLHDLYMNRLAFEGLPSIAVTYTGEAFEIRLGLGQFSAGPLSISLDDGKAFVKRFDEFVTPFVKKEPLDIKAIKAVQKLLVSLEGQFSEAEREKTARESGRAINPAS